MPCAWSPQEEPAAIRHVDTIYPIPPARAVMQVTGRCDKLQQGALCDEARPGKSLKFPESGQNLFRRNGQVPHPDADGVVNGIGDGRRWNDEAWFRE